MKNALLLYAKGMAMGAADVVPGVSGGTVAFITGIYDELLGSIASVPNAVAPLLKGRVAEAWRTANATFLLVLFAGILTSVFSLAKLITYLLEHHPIPVWSFFFGLILVSVHLVGKEIQRRSLSRLLSLCLGIGFAYWITVASPVQWGTSGISIFFAGAIAICAMILPGISGSFILVLLGLYPVILGAVKDRTGSTAHVGHPAGRRRCGAGAWARVVRRARPASCAKRLNRLVDHRERALKLIGSMRWIRSSSVRCALIAMLAGTLLAGCASSPSGGVSVVDRNSRDRVNSGHYVVRRGDTLWSIAFRFGWDWRDLARVNNIPPPHVIYPGQTIRFSGKAPRAVTARPATPPATPAPDARPPVVTNPVPIPPPLTKPSEPVAKPPVASTMVQPVARSASGWAWPTGGTVIGRFSSNGSLNKGIDIAGELGQPVLAASDGAVVYAGSGLRGYGELVIIKHSDTYVSAYGHNRRLLVQEGQQVKAGQTIAEMGSTGTDRVKLHFEIRRQGKPVDPLQYLPKR